MKKLLLLFVSLLIAGGAARADNDKPIDFGQLPAKAQTFVKTHFADRTVALTKMESGLFYKSYDVVFSTGEKVEFDKDGAWKEVQCRQSQVPAEIVPEAIRSYVGTTYPDCRILKIEIDDRGKQYEVELSNRLEICFDSRFRVIDIDD